MPENPDSDILLEHYRSLSERFTSQGNRLWMRFHYFLTGEAALLGAYLTRLADPSLSWPKTVLPLLGLFWTAVWFIVAAQDLWFYEQARKRLDAFKLKYIVSQFPAWDEDAEHYIVPRWKRPVCFKIPKCGVTTLASICPLLFVVLWVMIWILG